MPDTINLCSSSPELPAPRATTKADISVPQRLPLPSKPLTYQAQRRTHDNWFSISSDPVDSDDFPYNSKRALKPPSTSIEQRFKSNTLTKAQQSTIASSASNSVFFRSDDFDSTIVLDEDDPFASNLPPGKKQRLSPPYVPSMITRSPDYQKWIARLQSSSNSAFDAGPSQQAVAAAPNCTSNKPGVSRTKAGLLENSLPGASIAKRSVAADGVSSRSAASLVSASGLTKAKTVSITMDSDPIAFTSSPDPFAGARRWRKEQTKARNDQILVDSSDDDIFDPIPRKDAKGNAKPTESAALSSQRDNALRHTELESSDLELPDPYAMISQRYTTMMAKSKRNGKTVPMAALEKYEAEKAKEKELEEKRQRRKDKLAAKEAEKEQKRIAKMEKAKEKNRAAELAKVNTLKTDKKKSTPEMIVDLPSCLEKGLMEQIQTFLTPVEAQHTEYESAHPIIKWRRKIESEFDLEAGHWDKVESYVGREKHIICIMKGPEFIDLATGEEGKDLDSHVLRLKAKFATNAIIYLIEGLEPWMRKNKNLQNRKYVQEVRNQILEEAAAPIASQKRKSKPEREHVDEDLVEDVLLKLQVVHGVLIHHTKVQIETAEWVVIFTQHISTVRYRIQKQSIDTNFCMESGQVKVGDGPADTYTKMLQEMVRVTPAVAYGIAAEYSTVQMLVKGLKDGGPLALQNCRKSANKDGAFTDKRIGPAISKRVHNVFTCHDGGIYDV